MFSFKITTQKVRKVANYILIIGGILLLIFTGSWATIGISLIGLNGLLGYKWKNTKTQNHVNIGIVLAIAIYYLTVEWLPLGPQKGTTINFIMVIVMIFSIIGLLWLFVKYYEEILEMGIGSQVEVYDDSYFHHLIWGSDLDGF